ncbi:MAG: hypothetical protein ABMB14_25400 [Myxococcota bacterium]
MMRIHGPELALIAGAVCVAAVAAAVVAAALVVAVVVVRRRRAGSPVAREDALRELGYTQVDAKTWTRPVPSTAVVFTDGAGFTWTVRLPRYNTLTLQVEERDGGTATVIGAPFPTGNPKVDERFAVSSERAAQALALATHWKVVAAMTAMPWLSLRLRADELVLADPQKRGLGKPANPVAALAAEKELHLAVAVLVTAVIDSLYSKQTGTLMPEHR